MVYRILKKTFKKNHIQRITMAAPFNSEKEKVKNYAAFFYESIDQL